MLKSTRTSWNRTNNRRQQRNIKDSFDNLKGIMNGTDNYYSMENHLPYSDSVRNLAGNMTKSTEGENSSMGGDDGEEVNAVRLPPLLKVPVVMAVILSLAYLVVFVLAVVNNSLVVSVICRNPQMRNVTNFFLANLAVADITVSFLVLPITLLSNLFTGKIQFRSLGKM